MPLIVCLSQISFHWEIALLELTNDIMETIDSGKITILSFLDMSVAFDTFEHTTLTSAYIRIIWLCYLLNLLISDKYFFKYTHHPHPASQYAQLYHCNSSFCPWLTCDLWLVTSDLSYIYTSTVITVLKPNSCYKRLCYNEVLVFLACTHMKLWNRNYISK